MKITEKLKNIGIIVLSLLTGILSFILLRLKSTQKETPDPHVVSNTLREKYEEKVNLSPEQVDSQISKEENYEENINPDDVIVFTKPISITDINIDN